MESVCRIGGDPLRNPCKDHLMIWARASRFGAISSMVDLFIGKGKWGCKYTNLGSYSTQTLLASTTSGQLLMIEAWG